MKQVIQHILFPDDESLYDYRDMFYHGDRGVLTEGGSLLCLGKYNFVEFNTYFNGVSYGKWKQYSSIKQVYLEIEVQGECEITLCGYRLANDIPARKMLVRKHVDAKEKTTIYMEYPENQEQMLSFEIKTLSDVTIYGGHYSGEFDDENERTVELSLATTTCWKEEYIKKNVERLKKGILDLDEEIGSHFRIHIVDNGRTLSREDFPEDDRIYYHPNTNAGGAGGFARGMIESRHQTPKATHVLLMDDDVMILPDSIFRTYVLLKNIKPEYKDSFIGGAMLILEEKNIQHEDVGTVDDMGMIIPLKPRWNHFLLRDNLLNEQHYKKEHMYQAWWYCCIPMHVIEKNGFPLPLFIRIDDAEYSLRCKADIITMNGICVWHMGFYGKYNASMDIYQASRNFLIIQATTDVLPECDLIKRYVKKYYRDNMLKHEYEAAELTLRAFEDYMKGPKFIMQNKGESIIKENRKLNNKFKPLKELEQYDVDIYGDPYWDSQRGFWKKWIYRITYNGHRFYPEKFLNKKPVIIPFDFGYTPSKMAMKKTYIAVNPISRQGVIKELDKKRFKELQKRYYQDMRYYTKNSKAIKNCYKKARKTLTSEAFWKKYLEI